MIPHVLKLIHSFFFIQRHNNLILSRSLSAIFIVLLYLHQFHLNAMNKIPQVHECMINLLKIHDRHHSSQESENKSGVGYIHTVFFYATKFLLKACIIQVSLNPHM